MDRRRPCRSGPKCYNPLCTFAHPPGWSACAKGVQCADGACASIHPPDRAAVKGQDSAGSPGSTGGSNACPHGKTCWNPSCPSTHPSGWSACPVGGKCTNKMCSAAHPPPCKYGSRCTNKSCVFLHSADSSVPPACPHGEKCWNVSCANQHPASRSVCSDGANCADPDCACTAHPPAVRSHCPEAAACEDFACTLAHPRTRMLCRFAASCFNWDCGLLHPEDRVRCALADKCINFDCDALHPKERRRACLSGADCTTVNCAFLHPSGRCPDGIYCKQYACELSHPRPRSLPCASKERCMNFSCLFAHPVTRAQLCDLGADCHEFSCALLHPDGRPRRCRFAEKCINALCVFLHPSGGRVVCSAGDACEDFLCAKLHPPTRVIVCAQGAACSNAYCERLHPQNWKPPPPPPPSARKDRARGQRATPSANSKLRTAAQRAELREKNRLPIFASRQEFIDRLKAEKVLVVTAETGSGKTTQLPQYAAEAFGGLVVCTQPRALAAVSISQRIADEFDGAAVGENVGYRVGGAKSVDGRQIMLMTDASLIRMAQRDPALRDVSVLVIDEAHERSLNTDLVVGIAKLVRQLRPNDFYVVIASATIDPKPFLDFYDSKHGPLNVPGRTFPVTLSYRPVDENDDVTSALVPIVIEAMGHTEGHCLVFLPGSKEVDSAIRQFKSASPSDAWVPLPLYGGLPPEEQQRVMNFDSQDDSLRMVVFCTNVAETSLTVPNVRLVIDTGLAKEARYDSKRRLTVLEQVYVSRSSADQRKGRAGRTAPGHAIRLFAPEQLTRQNIEPEILRSSLDLVVLQLKRLDHDPLSFPFITRPATELLQASVTLLTEFGCLNAASGHITERGKLFSELELDPRLSQFITLAHEQFGSAKLAATLAALVTAPGNIFFMGGGGAARTEAKQRVALAAAEYSSDLLFLYATFNEWLAAGKLDETATKCASCKRVCSSARGDGCRVCRTKHAVENGLNNKVLDMVRSSADKVLTRLSKSKQFGAAGAPSLHSAEEIVGRCLAQCFTEQIAEMLIAGQPDAGVHLFSSGVRGNFASTSALAQRATGDPAADRFLVSMSIMQAPSGGYFVDQAHRLRAQWLPAAVLARLQASQRSVVECYTRPSVSSRFRGSMFKMLKAAAEQGDEGAKFSVVNYDNDARTLRVFGPQAQQAALQCLCAAHLEAELRSELEYELPAQAMQGAVSVIAQAGLVLDQVQLVGFASAIRFSCPPMENDAELRQWLVETVGVSAADIKWAHFYPASNDSDAYARATFRSEAAANRALEITGKLAAEKGAQSSSIMVQQTEEWGRRVLWRVPSSVTVERARQAIVQSPAQPRKMDVLSQRTASFAIVMSNLPPSCTDVAFMATMRSLQMCKSTTSREPPQVELRDKKQVKARFGTLYFDDRSSRDAALAQLSRVMTEAFEIRIPPNNKAKMVAPAFEAKDKDGSTDLALIFGTTDEAEQFVAGFGSRFAVQGLHAAPGTVDGQAVVMVAYPSLFELHSMVEKVCLKFGVTASVGEEREAKKSKRAVSSVVFAGSVGKCGLAAQALATATAPIRVRLIARRQQVLIGELHDRGALQVWASQLSLMSEVKRDHHGNCFELQVFGPQHSQGSFMAKIGEQSDAFDVRYELVALSSAAQCLFRRGKVGAAKLAELAKEVGAQARVAFVPPEGSIEVYVALSATTAAAAAALKIRSDLVKRVHTIVLECGAKTVSQGALGCVYCSSPQKTRQFSVCGHNYCADCLQSVSLRSTSEGVPVTCRLCQQRVSVRDLRLALDQNALDTAIGSAVKWYLRRSPAHQLALCPTSNCTGILKKKEGYALCSACHSSVCPLCSVTNNDLHKGRDCLAFRKALKAQQMFNLNDVFKRGRDFVSRHWDVNLGNPARIDDNAGLARGCPAMVRFAAGVKQLGVASLQQGFFAWHGTPSEAGVVGICHDGFDPKRRSAQACGPGEYFGQSAAVSSGYAGGSGRMIVALLLRAPVLSTHGTFCFVMDNPTDWSLAYNLPLLVVTYNSNLACPAFTNAPPVNIPLLYSDDTAEEELSVDASTSTWHAPFRWHWQTDSNSFEPYKDTENQVFEEAFARFQCGLGPAEFTTRPITRYVDDTPQVYRLNFLSMTQQNARTGYTRAVKRERTEALATNGVRWEWKADAGSWAPFESLVQGLIENSYRRYTDGLSPAVHTGLQFPGRPERYSLDFVAGTQRNEVSGAVRAVRRLAQRKGDSRSRSEETSITIPAAFAHLLPQFQESELPRLTQELATIVKNGLGNTSFSPLLRIEGLRIVLVLQGPARVLAAVLVGRIRASLFGISQGRLQFPALDLSSSSVATNPRIKLLSSNEQPMVTLANRTGAMLLIVHFALWELKCVVYGGFVRDWVVRGEPANDVDLNLPPNVAVATIEVQLCAKMQALGMQVKSRHPKGMAYAVVFSGPWDGEDICVDLVEHRPSKPKRPPGVDTDVGNMCFSADRLLSIKEPRAGAPLLSLAKCLRHCEKKKFVFFYNTAEQHPDVHRRMHKYLSRGWMCLSAVSRSLMDQLEASLRTQVQPRDNYSRAWWSA